MNREAKSKNNRPDYVSYLLRLWRDDGGHETDSVQRPAAWRGSLENPLIGQRLGFPNMEALFQHLRAETGVDSASPKLAQDGQDSRRRARRVAMGVCLAVLLMVWCAPIMAGDAVTLVTLPGLTSSTSENATVSGAADRVVSFQGKVSGGVTGSAGVQLALSAPHTTTSWDERDPAREKIELPMLTLHRGRAATPVAERTLNISITGVTGESEIVIEAHSHHADVRTGERHRASARIVLPDRACTTADLCEVQWTFDPGTTPSDLYYLSLSNGVGETLWEQSRRPAFVMLDTWDIGLVARRDATYTARVYFGTLFPFARGENERERRLSPDQVTDFIERQFLPIIEETWRTQAEEWGFGDPMHPAWDGDGMIDIIITPPPFALFDGTGTYSVLADAQGRPYPERRIWWLSTNDSFADYVSLADGYKAVFAHEFFHLMQWNVLLNTGQATNYWPYAFIEGQGMFTPSAQYPELTLRGDGLAVEQSPFAARASGYLTRRLNSSWREMETDGEHRYDAALYWRFLYETCGEMSVLRVVLEEMARHYNPDILLGVEPAMDATFARLDGPFTDFQESLIAFSRANYALRLANGRCTEFDSTECAGRYFDPKHMYGRPVLETHIQYDGFGRTYRGSVPSSYGMDFLEVGLDAPTQGQSLTVRFQGTGDVAHFNVQVWRLKWGEKEPQAVTQQPEVVVQESDGAYVYHIPAVDMAAYDRLGLIITRLDNNESMDPVGPYQLTIGS